jgi:hypothetical protein
VGWGSNRSCRVGSQEGEARSGQRRDRGARSLPGRDHRPREGNGVRGLTAKQLGDQQWHKEWGGKHAADLCFATEPADILVKRLGKDLGRFLDLVDKAEPGMIFDLLREVVAAEAASAQASVVDGIEAQSVLPL